MGKAVQPSRNLEREIGEIVWLVDSEHLYDTTNIELKIQPDRLCEIDRKKQQCRDIGSGLGNFMGEDANPGTAKPQGNATGAPQPASQSGVATDRAAKSDAPNGESTRNQDQKPPATPQRRSIFIVAAIVALGILGFLGWLLFIGGDTAETHIELMGNIDVRQVNLAFKVDGRIDSLAVDEGDSVKTNDIIAMLDKHYFNDELRVLRAKRDNLAASVAKLEHGSRPQEIAQARAQTADRESALVKAKEDFHRAEGLVEKGGVSRQDFDRYHFALDSAQAQFNSAKESQRLVEIGPRQEDIDFAKALLNEQDATIAQSERRLGDADLVAPNDGIILTRARERGAIVQPGETVFALTLNSPVWARTYVNERDLGLIAPNLPVNVVTDSAPERPYFGNIGFISPTAEFTPKAVETRELRTDLVYRLRVVVDNPDGGLRQGMPVTIRVQLSQPRRRTFWEQVHYRVRSRLHMSH